MRLFKSVALTVSVLLLLTLPGFAQDDLESLMDRSGSVFANPNVVLPLETPPEAMFALDAPVDPNTYILGPGDVLGVSLPRMTGGYSQIMLGPDGSLAVPNMPVVQLSGMTISEAREFLSNEWSGGGDGVVIALMQMRRVRVSVGGEITMPGQYIVSPADRASILVELAFGAKRSAHPRRATLVHRDGSRENVDLLRFKNSGVSVANPYLAAGDHLVLHPKRIYEPMISVGGAVVKPGSFPWIEGDDVMAIIELAGGWDEMVLGDSLFVTGLDDAGKLTQKSVLVASLDHEENRGIALHPGDAIRVQEVSFGTEHGAVVVSGEVMRPGAYPIIDGETHLSEVIALAGGFTDMAWLEGARVWKSWPENDPRSNYARALDSLTTPVNRYIDQEVIRNYHRDSGRDYLTVDFPSVFSEGGVIDPEQDVVLYDSLQITVPREVHTVLVTGQVKQPGMVPFHEGWSYKDYVKEAGGFAKSAQKKRTRLIPYQSSVWYTVDSRGELQPGDIIFVPEEDEKSNQETFSAIASLLIQGATLVTLVWRTFFLD